MAHLVLPGTVEKYTLLSCPVMSHTDFVDFSRARGFTSVDGKHFEWRRIREDTSAYDVSGMVKFL